MTKINAARAAAGLPAVSVHADLVGAARRHSTEMAERNALYHSSLAGICCYRSLAENVGVGASPGVVHVAFMGSSGHRANILNPAMRHVGVGVVSSGGQLWVTEIFRAPSGSAQALTAPIPPRPAVRAGTGARASRSTARRVPSYASVLKVRLSRLAHRAPTQPVDPLASALAWSRAMRTLTASPR
ncbi:MAG: CAP domain-containing protein [Sporichthyaceae bacterium]